jgi:hypothetical protein
LAARNFGLAIGDVELEQAQMKHDTRNGSAMTAHDAVFASPEPLTPNPGSHP